MASERKKKSENTKAVNVSRSDMMVLFIAIAVIVGFVFFGALLLEGANSNMKFHPRISNFGDGWTFFAEGERKVKDLPIEVSSDENGEVVMRKVLPQGIPKYYVVVCRNYHQNLEVRIDGELRYKYPYEERNPFVNIITDDWHMIELNPTDSRKIMEIKFIKNGRTELNAEISEILYGEDNYLLQYLRREYIWLFSIGVGIIVAGIVLIIIGWVYRKYTKHSAQGAMGSVLLCFGIWLADRAKMPIFSINMDVKFLMAYVALLQVPMFIFVYCTVRFDGKWSRYSLWGAWISLGVSLSILLTSIMGGYSLETMTTVSYVASLIAMIYTAVLLYRVAFGKESIFKNSTELLINRIEFFATAVLPIGIILEISLYGNQLWTEIGPLYRIFIVLYTISYIVTVFIGSYREMQDREGLIERLHDSQLELMMGQIQPHFVFNTLSSIRTLIKIEPETAYSMIYDFSNYLRANVDNLTNMEGIDFAAEVEHIKSYVNIEKVRFGDRLNVEYDIKVSDFTVPPLSIQPLVENAIKHGVVKKIQGGTVWLKSYEEGEYKVVEVMDDGVGFDEAAMKAIFSVDDDKEDDLGFESAESTANALQEIMDASTLMDADGNIIELKGRISGDLKGYGTKEHKSTGMRNISLRLKEMANAKMEITSQVGKGTRIRVFFN